MTSQERALSSRWLDSWAGEDRTPWRRRDLSAYGYDTQIYKARVSSVDFS